MRAASLSLGLGLCFLALGCAGGKAAIVGSTLNDDAGAPEPAAAPSAAALDAGADASAPADQAESLPPAVDPAVTHALLAKSGEGSAAAPLGLRFEIVELGSELPWGFTIVNRGTEAAVVDFDARLLSLEIAPPPDKVETTAAGKPKPRPKKPRKPVICRLPADVAPSSVDAALAIKLEPGEGLAQSFDPRLYCVGKTPWPLVEGAVVTPHIGWPTLMKVSWKAGKREEKPGLQKEPFLAEPSEAEGSLPAGEQANDASERRVKELAGTPLTLGSDFSENQDAPKSAAADAPGLVLTISGGDATNEGTAVATTTFTNRGKKKQDVYFRRELVTYEVSGPDGVFTCDPEPDQRAPVDRSAIQSLRPGGKFSAVSRLIEMCPAHAFARPGLYLVHARFDSADSGSALGLHAFMGRLVSPKPALVRIREGELPFTPLSSAVRVHVGE
ncbi:MAG TPA: hypothetical protein VHW01_28505 [Polyangiaceae bacterium]|jgi:hypothetical protein|nr:hypothetical protein [Polyangiaceae bacterium]